MAKLRVLSSLLTVAVASTAAIGAGRHAGEAGKIQAHVSFLNPSGHTTADSSGITYRVGGWSFHENKVYPPAYWGTYPLYFMGHTMRFSVALTNTATQGKKSFKVRIQAINRVLETNGALGMVIAPAQDWTVDSLRPGETRTLQGSIHIPLNRNLPSGLDVTKIRILHLNQGSNPDAGLIKEVIAVWCPPDLKARP